MFNFREDKIKNFLHAKLYSEYDYFKSCRNSYCFIANAFEWDKTPEGFCYWDKLSKEWYHETKTKH